MMPAAVVYDNLADAATVSASTSEILAQPQRVQNEHVARRWRSLTAADVLVVDFGALVSIDTVAAIGLSASTARLRISTSDYLAGDLYDSGVGAVSADYRQSIWLLPAPVSGRYLTIDLANSAASYCEMGRLVAGVRSAYDYNFSYGWGVSHADLSTRRRTRGGQMQISRDERYRVFDLAFELVSESDRYGFVDAMDRINGLSRDVLFISDPESSTLPRDTLWGLVSETTPVIQPHFEHYSKSYRIEERL